MQNFSENELLPTPVAPAPGCDLYLLALIGIILFIPWLGLRDISSSHEARVAQVARQMRTSGTAEGWIVPRIGDNTRFQKPPLAYWMAAIASLPFADIDEFNSRLPNAASAIGAMLLLYLLSLHLTGNRILGWVSALTFATTSEIWLQGRTTGTEMPLLFLNILGLYSWWRYFTRDEAKSFRWLLLAYLAMGFALLQKGPVGPPLVMLIVVVYLTASHQWKRPMIWHHAIGFLAMLLVALPWPILLLLTAPEAWDVMESQVFSHITTGTPSDHPKPWHYFLLRAFGDGQPWILFGLLGAFSLKSIPQHLRKRLLFPVVWAAVTLLYFSVPTSKKGYYILMLYPALALLAAVLFTYTDKLDKWARGSAKIIFACFGIILLLAGTGIVALLIVELARLAPAWKYVATRWRLTAGADEILPYLTAAMPMILIFGLAIFKYRRSERYLAAAFTLGFATCAVFATYIALTPLQNRHKGDKELCLWLKPQLKPDDRVFSYELSGLSVLMNYLNRNVVKLATEDQIITEAEKQAERNAIAWYIISEKEYRPLTCAFFVTSNGDKSALRELVKEDPALSLLWEGTGSYLKRRLPDADRWLLVRVTLKDRKGKSEWDRIKALDYLVNRLGKTTYTAKMFTDIILREPCPATGSRHLWLRSFLVDKDATPKNNGLNR